MERDVINNIYVILHSEGIFIKVNIFPEKNPGKRMVIGTVVFKEDEARRVYAALRAFFEKTEYPEYLKTIDMRGMQKASQEFRVRTEVPKSAPLTAEQIQQQNFEMEKRLQSLAEKKKEAV